MNENEPNKKSWIYQFYWGKHESECFNMRIWANKETVEKMLNEYRLEDPKAYNNTDWSEFLSRKGIKNEFVDPDYYIYF